MYNLVTNLVDEIYHGKTGNFLGYATFELPQTEEEKILNLVNYGETPKCLILLNLDVIKTAKDYVPPELIKKYSRAGILRALFRDADSGVLMPIEICLKYDARGRGQETGDIYHFDSVEYSNIEIGEIRYNTNSN
ncbi:hypothetical protein OBV_27120 [Oscillibacter valericigenes Sjm18-20]|nr:hypothetical protein OBV_27120 [Oscillibacter valericigenes Sjm18-20]